MTPRLIISDIDGTLVPDGSGAGSLNPAYYDVIRSLTGQGITFAACSGRQFTSIYKMLEPVAEQIYFICDGGGVVCDGHHNILHTASLPRDTVREIIEDAGKIPQLDIMVDGAMRSYCRSRDSELYRWMVDGYGFDIEAVGDLDAGIEEDVIKVSLYHHDAAEALTAEWFRPKWEPRVKTVIAGIQWLDMMSFASGKGEAVAFLQKHLSISKDETIVFGDNQNDMDMFAQAGKSYAVAGAREEVREAADEICGSMEEDGVYEVLKNISDCGKI